MTLQLINPAGLPPQATYTQVVVATGSTMVFIAGQDLADYRAWTPPTPGGARRASLVAA